MVVKKGFQLLAGSFRTTPVVYYDAADALQLLHSALSRVFDLIIPTICLYEVCKRALLQFDEERALAAIGAMSDGMLVELDRTIAIEAAHLSLDLKLSMADSIILATARAHDATLWTQDAHIKDIEGVRYIEKSP
jgi:predicted nucleic acid-binding protein